MSSYIINRPENDIDFDAFLERCCTGLKERYGASAPDEALDRLNNELAVIVMLRLASTFHVASEFAAEARRQNVFVAPRCERAGFPLTAYILGISGIDPLACDASPNRHPSPENIENPIVMIQLESDQERGIVRCIEERFGEGIVELAG